MELTDDENFVHVTVRKGTSSDKLKRGHNLRATIFLKKEIKVYSSHLQCGYYFKTKRQVFSVSGNSVDEIVVKLIEKAMNAGYYGGKATSPTL